MSEVSLEIIIKSLIHYKTQFRDPQILDQFDSLLNLLNSKENTVEAIDGQLFCLYIVETSLGHVKVGISKNPQKRLKSLASGGGFSVTKYYVTLPMRRAKSREGKILDQFKHSRIEGEYLTSPFSDVVKAYQKRFGDNENKEFNLVYDFSKSFSSRVYCSNGNVYKSIGSFAKAFGIKRKLALKHLNTGSPIKGVTIRTTKDPVRTRVEEPQAIEARPFESKVILRKRDDTPTQSQNKTLDIPKTS